jgi:hypothetical protein
MDHIQLLHGEPIPAPDETGNTSDLRSRLRQHSGTSRSFLEKHLRENGFGQGTCDPHPRQSILSVIRAFSAGGC